MVRGKIRIWSIPNKGLPQIHLCPHIEGFLPNSEILQSSLNSSLVGPIAQSVEQRTFNPWVDGSSPSGPTFTFYLKSEFTFP